ncbi:MAG: Stp1/IreP family PP2C-type Ser/Thr phosphatase [Bacillota bacterium]
MVLYAVRSHRGCIREINEDRYFIPPQEGPCIFAVADGMGGHAAGEVASSMAIKILEQSVKEISENFHQLSQVQAEEFLLSAIQQANTEIIHAQEQQNELKGMGTTLTAAFIRGRELLIGHVGDSQAYIFRDDGFYQLTEDHSLVMELLKNGEINAEEVYTHPQRHLITRFLGIASPVSVDFYVTTSQPGDYLLLCTDGLTAMLRPPEIKELLFSGEGKSLDTIADELLSRANSRGGPDNITFALIHLI